jgi:DNA-binding transcriptional MerR regulator
MTEQKAMETLGRLGISSYQLAEWETELGLEIPVDDHGEKLYSPLHLNLFKNVGKHLSMGRSLEDIKRMVVLPVQTTPSFPQAYTEVEEDPLFDDADGPETFSSGAFDHEMAMTQQSEMVDALLPNTLSRRILKEIRPLSVETAHAIIRNSELTLPARPFRSSKRFATPPTRLSAGMVSRQPGQHAGLLVLIDKLISEKDVMQEEVTRLEKQNTHLQQANQMFQAHVHYLTAENDGLKAQLHSPENLRLIDDKARLQKELMMLEKHHTEAERTLQAVTADKQALEIRLAKKIDPKLLLGHWVEEAILDKVLFDNFGINVEPKRSRLFKITQPPERFFGHTAIIETVFDYRTNALWKRTETLILSLITPNHLTGEMISEYMLDGTPVARVKYRVECRRNTSQNPK